MAHDALFTRMGASSVYRRLLLLAILTTHISSLLERLDNL